MPEVVLYHHVHGQTDGFGQFADELRAQGHVVHTPDLYAGEVFSDFGEAIDFAESVGFAELLARGIRAADDLPEAVVYAGFSLGGLPAQALAQTRPRAQGALLFHAAVPVTEFGGDWPGDVPVDIHAMDADPIFVGEGDIEAAQHIAKVARHGRLFLYPGHEHLFADSSLESFDAAATALMTVRVFEFLDAVSG